MDVIKQASRRIKHVFSSEHKRVYNFSEGSNNKSMYGMKGAALCEMTRMLLPVPPGFIITSDNFLEYLDCGEGLNKHLKEEVKSHIHALECHTGRKFGGRGCCSRDKKHNVLPLLLSVRAAASIVVPGIMDTVLNVGMNDSVVAYLIETNQGLTKFALDLHRRFLFMFGTLVLRTNCVRYERVLNAAMDMDGVNNTADLSVDALTFVVGEFKRFTDVPEDPYDQLFMVIEAMYLHSLSPKVSEYLDQYSTSIPQNPRALAVIVQMMVYGNLNANSGSGVAFSRPLNYREGEEAPVGEYMTRAEGKEVLEGTRESCPLEDLRYAMPNTYVELLQHLWTMEEKDNAIEYVEFTVEDGKLYLLETSAVNLHPNKKDSRFVVYFDLLQKLQKEEEEEEEYKMSVELK